MNWPSGRRLSLIDLLKNVLALVLRFLDWRRDTAKSRERNEVRKAVAEHDREALNAIIQERRQQ